MTCAERQELNEFLRFYRLPGLDVSVMVNHWWVERDLLAHIVAWHESYASNLELLAAGQPAEPPRGTLREVNKAGVIALEGRSVAN